MFNVGVPDEGWDNRQRERGAHMLQGRPWGQFQAALGRQVLWAEDADWSWMGFVLRSRGTSHLYLPYGPWVANDESLVAALTSAGSAAGQHGLDFARCEPLGSTRAALLKAGLKPAPPVQPEHTSILDLEQSEESLFRGLRSGHRNSINGAERRGLSISLTREPAAIDAFLRLLRLTTQVRGFRAHPDTYFRTMLEVLMPSEAACLGLAAHEGRVIGAAIALDYQGTRAYAHAAADPAARRLGVAAPLVWRLLQDAKTSGMHRFDLWGVAAPDAPPDHPWHGFSEFKRAFGGAEISHSGTWELPIKRWRYRLYSRARRLTGRNASIRR